MDEDIILLLNFKLSLLDSMDKKSSHFLKSKFEINRTLSLSHFYFFDYMIIK